MNKVWVKQLIFRVRQTSAVLAASAFSFSIGLAAVRLIFRLVSFLGLLGIVESLKHSHWMYRAKHPVFRSKHYISNPMPIDDQDVQLAERLILAWRKAHSHTKPVSGLWDERWQPEISALFKPLNEGNAPQLAETLGNMFHSGFIHGMSHGWRHRGWGRSKVVVPVIIEDRLVSLAEAIGVTRSETCEQGDAGFAMRDGVEALVEKVEKTLDISMAFPLVGAPSGVMTARGLLTMRQMDHVYAAHRIERTLELHLPTVTRPCCVEIGGGYGGLALWFLRLRQMNVQSYTIIDLPWVNVIQGYFLTKVFGVGRVALYSDNIAEANTRLIRVLPAEALQGGGFLPQPLDVVINQDSMPEMPSEVVESYLQWIAHSTRGLFFSYQQESCALFQKRSQICVHDLLKQNRQFKLLSRDRSWVRSGYAEEVYRI